MSLLAWFPLNGNLNNQGISDISATNTGMVVDNSGVIGKCYSFTTADKFTLSNVPFASLTNCSVTFWIYITNSANWLPFNGQDGTHYFMATSGGTGNFYHQNAGSPKIYINGVIGTAPQPAGMWVHYAITNVNISSWTQFRFNSYSSWTFAGKINDVRLYDHVLSDKEVKEIAKGLCLHYSFAHNVFDNEFLILEDGTKWRKLLHHNNPSKNMFTTANYKNLNTQDLYSKLYLLDTPSNFLLSNGTYEFLIKEKPLATSTEYWYRWSQTSDPGSSTSITGFTSIQNDTNSGYIIGLKKDQSAHGYMHNGGSWWVCCGSFTAYNGGIPGAGTTVTTGYMDLYARYESLNYEVGDPIYDDSGFRNDGSIYSATSIAISDQFNAPRYKECLNVQGSGSWINAPCPRLTNFSYSFWFKRNRASQSQREMLCTGWYGISFELNTNDTLTFREAMTTSHTIKDVISTMTFTTGVWYHVVCTHKDGVESKMYINGELHKTVALTDPIDYTAYFMQIATYNSSTYQFNGQLSDFRVYASVLSASDVKELYNVGGTIDNKGNLFSYELDEN